LRDNPDVADEFEYQIVSKFDFIVSQEVGFLPSIWTISGSRFVIFKRSFLGVIVQIPGQGTKARKRWSRSVLNLG